MLIKNTRTKLPGSLKRLIFFGLLLTLSIAALANDFVGPDDELMNLSLEELLNLEVTTVSRRSQSLSTASAAVFVITDQDIRRSGANSIPDVLRMVPGVSVAQIDGNKWAVTARGFNGRFAGKLLVLMDGRTLYTPLFSGVFWDVQDVSLESIARIEVVRGPGATLWGANAVNGVINIITKPASESRGGYAHAGVSSEGGNEAVFRYGGSLSTETDYRLYFKHLDRAGNRDLANNPTADDWRSTRIGLRIDSKRSDRDSLMFMTEHYDSSMGETIFSRSVLPPYESIVDSEKRADGHVAQLSWTRTLSDDAAMTLQGYYDHRDRALDSGFRFSMDTFDLDFQHAFTARIKHEIVWGLGYRHNTDEIGNGFGMALSPTTRAQKWASAFIQDEIALSPDNLYLTVGSKFEHNSFSDKEIEFEPNIRLRWKISQTSTAWASISRAVRLPSRGDLDSRAVTAVLPPLSPLNTAPVPIVISVSGSPNARSEELTAYEFGYRSQPTANLALDVALFFHDHDDERNISQGVPVCAPSAIPVAADPLCVLSAQHIENPFHLGNGGTSESYGIEIVADWAPTSWWRLQTSYSRLKFSDSGKPSAPAIGTLTQDSPEHQLSARSLMNIGSNTEFDLWLRYTDELQSLQIDSYLTLDARLGWSPRPGLQLSIGGRNLLEGAHREFVSEIRDVVPVQLERRAYIEARWSF